MAAFTNHKVRSVLVAWALLSTAGATEFAFSAGSCPLGTDADADAVCDAMDSCVRWPNPISSDTNGDGIGDICQCGDSSGDGDVDIVDAAITARELAALGPGLTSTSPNLCDLDLSGSCDAPDLTLLRQALAEPNPTLATSSTCANYTQVLEHVLSRIGYGGDAWSRGRLEELGPTDYIGEQLDPDLIADPDFDLQLDPYINGAFATWNQSVPLLESQFCNAGGALCTNRIAGPKQINAQLAEVKFLRGIYTRRQLEAVLLDFWFNHFNVDGTTGIVRWAGQEFEQFNIRPHVLGQFEHLVQAMTEGLAMLDYLDLRRNNIRNTNENFGRELMELHTSGPIGTYDENDVQEVTRVLTGYTYDGDRVFEYKPNNHDTGVKTVSFVGTPVWTFDTTLGCDGIPASSFANEGEVLICLLSRHPVTGERISRKLIERFVTETPAQAFVDQIAAVWATTDGDLKQVMQAILLSPEFLSLDHIREKVRRPHFTAASLIRATGPGTEGTSLLTNQPYSNNRKANSFNGIMGDMALMGEALFEAGPPTGYPEASVAWAAAGSLMSRFNLAEKLVQAVVDPVTTWNIPSAATSEQIVDDLVSQLLPAGLQPATRLEVIDFLDNDLPASATLEDRVRQAASLILATPESLAY